MNNNITNPELLKAFLEPMVNELVDERVKQELEKRMASIKARNEPERPILIEDAAEILGYSRSHMYTLCREKKYLMSKRADGCISTYRSLTNG